MSPSLSDVVENIRAKYFAYPPANSDAIETARVRGVPDGLLALYALCDGMLIGEGDDFPGPDGKRYRLKIPALADLTTTQSYGFIDENSPLYPRSAQWWQMVDYGDSNWLAYDGSCAADGIIIDVYHETVGEPSSHKIVASSITELPDCLCRHDGVYWLGKQIPSLRTI